VRVLLFDELREAWLGESRDHRIALGSIVVIAIALRLLYLAQPIRYDEAVTYLLFVRQPWSEALSSYVYPNNHLFHTLLAKASITVFGDAPWALRLPAFAAGTLLVVATYAVARALYGGRVALFAAAIVASSGVLVLYSTNARGYMIVALAFLLLILAIIRLTRGAAPSQWLMFATIAALGLWTIPVMLYPLGVVCVWFALNTLIADRRDDLRRMGIALGLAAGLTLLAYSPVMSAAGIGAITRNRFVAPTGWYEFFTQLPPSLGEALRSWSLGVPPIVSLTLLACSVVAVARHTAISSLSLRVNIVLATYVWCAWLLVVTHRAPFPRVWIWFLPIAASLAAAGAVLLLERWPRTQRMIQQRAPTLAVAFALGAATSVILSSAVLTTRDTGTYRDAPVAAAELSRLLRPGDRVLAAIPTNAPLEYYLDKHGVHPIHLSLDERSAQRILVVVDAAEGQTLPRVVGQSEVRDSTRFAPPVEIAAFSASRLVMFERRNVSTK
jgi:hypothetical protein